MQTQAVEDYLKAIFELQQTEDKVATTSLANHMKVTAASVTGMIKKLAELKLVTYQPYQGVELTDAGEKIALEVIRHHRLVERYLSEALGVPWDQVRRWSPRVPENIWSQLRPELLGIASQGFSIHLYFGRLPGVQLPG